MKVKATLFSLMILLLLGSRYSNYVATPNQQVVVAFSKVDISEKEKEETINRIKNTLLQNGASQITITSASYDGALKINYHSSSHVSYIENVLVNQLKIKVTSKTQQKLPQQNKTTHTISDYALQINELNNVFETSDFVVISITSVDDNEVLQNYITGASFSTQHYNSAYSYHHNKITKPVRNPTSVYRAILPETRAGPVLF